MTKENQRNRRKRSDRSRPPKRSSRQLLFGIVGLAVAAVVILIIVQQVNQPAVANREGLDRTTAKSLGSEDAPVVLTDYSDFQ